MSRRRGAQTLPAGDKDRDQPNLPLRRAAFAPSFHSAVRVFLGSRAIVLFFLALAAALLTLRRAAPVCLAVAMISSSLLAPASAITLRVANDHQGPIPAIGFGPLRRSRCRSHRAICVRTRLAPVHQESPAPPSGPA